MALYVQHVTVYSPEPAALAQFWAAALSAAVTPDNRGFLLVPPGGSHGPHILFTQDPAHQTRWPHLHLTSTDGSLKESVSFLLRLGARILDDAPHGPLSNIGLGSVTMADPEGHEFSIESSDAEKAAAAEALDAGQAVDRSGSYFAGKPADPATYTSGHVRI